MTIELNFSAETATFLLERKSPLIKTTFLKADAKTGEITLQISSLNCETLAMGMFFAGQDKTTNEIKEILKAELI
jgi:hypothetical protein